MKDVNPIEKISEIAEFAQLNELMDDENVERGLLKLASILTRPEINPTNIARHVIEIEALATYYAIRGKHYMTIGKNEPNAMIKKNYYLTLREEFHILANALKIMVRAQS